MMSGGSIATLTARLEAAIADALAQGTPITHVARFDVSGALTGALRPGDLACGLRVIGHGIDRVDCDQAWAARIVAATGARPTTFALTASIVWTAAAKQALGQQTGASVVDMESGVAMQFAADHGLSGAVFGAISDGAGQDLGEAATVALRLDGSINGLAVLRSIIANPSQIPDLLRLGCSSWRAYVALAGARAKLGANFCAPCARSDLRAPQTDKETAMLTGFKTFAIGLGLALLPQAISYVSNFDFVHTFGLSPNAATIIGVVIIAMRAATTTPMFKAS